MAEEEIELAYFFFLDIYDLSWLENFQDHPKDQFRLILSDEILPISIPKLDLNFLNFETNDDFRPVPSIARPSIYCLSTNKDSQDGE